MQIHAYDTCRSNLDVKNCAQHACTEVIATPTVILSVFLLALEVVTDPRFGSKWRVFGAA